MQIKKSYITHTQKPLFCPLPFSKISLFLKRNQDLLTPAVSFTCFWPQYKLTYFMSCFFPSKSHLWEPNKLLHVYGVHSFSLSCSIPLYECITVYLPILMMMDSDVVPSFGLLWICCYVHPCTCTWLLLHIGAQFSSVYIWRRVCLYSNVSSL